MERGLRASFAFNAAVMIGGYHVAMEYQGNNQSLVYGLVKSGVLKSPAAIDAFLAVDRADFVPEEDMGQAYFDTALVIGYGQTVSQPSTVAFMMELLSVSRGGKVLDVGSGSGWTTALLGKQVGDNGRVIGIERVPELVEFGMGNLAKYGMPWAQIWQAGDRLGCPSQAPFDRILVSAAARELPLELVDQLAEGGRMVLPILDSIWLVEKKSGNKWESKEFPGFAFVPLIK